jgi:hypothetical protein
MTATPAPVPAPTPASRWEDYLDIFIAPAQLFRRRTDGKFGQALLVYMVLAVVLFFGTRSAMQPIMDAEVARGMAAALKANPSLTPEQIEKGRAFASSFTAVFVVVGIPITLLVLGAVVWVAAKAAGGTVSYAQGATIATFAMFPKIPEGIAGAVQALLMDEGSLTSRFSVSLGLGRFLDPATSNGMLLALLGRVDLFTLWITVLIGIGLKIVAKLSTAQAAGGAALVWAIGALPTVWQAFRAM